jgi:hypothetical protein
VLICGEKTEPFTANGKLSHYKNNVFGRFFNIVFQFARLYVVNGKIVVVSFD